MGDGFACYAYTPAKPTCRLRRPAHINEAVGQAQLGGSVSQPEADAGSATISRTDVYIINDM